MITEEFKSPYPVVYIMIIVGFFAFGVYLDQDNRQAIIPVCVKAYLDRRFGFVTTRYYIVTACMRLRIPQPPPT